MEREELVKNLRFLLESPIWMEVLKPYLTARFDALSRRLLTDDNLKGKALAKIKGQIIELNNLILYPETTIKAHMAEQEAELVQNRQGKEAEFYAEHGRRSPYLPPDNALVE